MRPLLLSSWSLWAFWGLNIICQVSLVHSAVQAGQPQDLAVVQLEHAGLVPSAVAMLPTSNTTMTNVTLPPVRLNSNASFHVYTPQSPSQMPAILLMNGFSVEADWYSGVASHLRTAGYAVAITNYRLNVPINIPDLPRPGCPNGSYIVATAQLLHTVMKGSVLNTQEGEDGAAKVEEFRKTATANGVVILSHSAGGQVAINLLTAPESNDCTLDDEGRLTAATSQLFCQGYSPSNASSLPPVLGMVMYEAYSNKTNPVQFKNGTFMVHIVGENNPNTSQAYQEATFVAPDGAPVCKGFVEIKANHFGINNFVPDIGGKQVTPCARTASAPGEKNYTITEADQTKNVALVAEITDLSIRMAVGTNQSRQAAVTRWEQVGKNDRVLQSTIDPMCMTSLQLGGPTSSPPAPSPSTGSPPGPNNNTASSGAVKPKSHMLLGLILLIQTAVTAVMLG